MATATAHRPPPINTKINPSWTGGVPRSGVSLKSGQVSASTASRAAIQEPRLLEQDDFKYICELSKDEKEAAFWRSQYKTAFEAQRKQSLAWLKIREGLKPDENGVSELSQATLSDFKARFLQYTAIGTNELAAVNEAIRKHAGNDVMKGGVRTFPARELCLARQEHWDIILKDRKLSNLFAPHYAWAHALQLFRNSWMSDPSSYNLTRDNEVFIETMEEINATISKLKLTKKQKKSLFGHINIPRVGSTQELPGDTDDRIDESESNEDDDQGTGEDVFPKEAMKILGEMGGNAGILQQYLISRNAIERRKLELKIEEIANRAESKAKELKFEGENPFNLIHIQTFSDGVEHSQEIYAKLRANPEDKELLQQYKGLRDQTESYMRQNTLPLNFIDSITPEIAGAKDGRNWHEVNQVLEAIGGPDGALNRYLHSRADGNVDLDAERKVKEIDAQILKVINGRGPFLAFSKNEELVADVKELRKAEEDCRKDVRNQVLEQKYFQIQGSLTQKYWELPAVWPAIIGDAITSQRFRNPLPPPAPPVAPSAELVATLNRIMSNFGGRDGCLSRYLHSSARGKPDIEALSQVNSICDSLRSQCGSNPTLSDYDITSPKLQELVDLTKNFRALENECANNPTFENIMKVGSCLDGLKLRFQYIQAVGEAVIGDIETSRRFMGTPLKQTRSKTKSKTMKNKTSKGKTTKIRVVPAPSIDNTPDQFISTGCEPGIVSEIVDGQEIKKAIVCYKEIGRMIKNNWVVIGHHLLLKSHDKERHAQPTFEWVAASKFNGAVDEFKGIGGAKWTPGTKSDLNGVMWSQCRVGGVAFVERDENKEYEKAATTYLLIIYKDTRTGMWYSISMLRAKFGKSTVDSAKAKYIFASGQKEPKQPLTRTQERAKHRAAYTDLLTKLANYTLSDEPRKNRTDEGQSTWRKGKGKKSKGKKSKGKTHGNTIDLTETDDEEESETEET